jgi:hypothetical protein
VFADGRLEDQGELHARDKSHNFVPRQARSKDGGKIVDGGGIPRARAVR